MVGVLLPDEQASVPGVMELGPEPPPDAELDGQVATVPTEETTPGVVRLFGSVMLTLFPTATVVCSEALNATCTWRTVEVACITAAPAWALPPGCADTLVTRTAEGSKTTWSTVSVPFSVISSAACTFITPAVLAGPKEAGLELSWARLA